MAQSQNKLVGTQYLDLTRLKRDVSETNTLLRSIGAGVNLNMSDVVEKQVREMLARFKNEIQSASQQMGQSGQQMSGVLKPAVSQIQALLTTTQKQAADGTLTETRKGYDELGRSITEVYKNGQLLSKSLTADSALTKDIRYANELYQEQIRYLKQVYALKTQRLKVDDGFSAAQDLDTQIADTERLINANKELIAQLDQQAVSRSKQINLSGEEAAMASKYAAAQAAQQEQLNAANSAGQAELKQVQQAYQQLTNSYRQYNQSVKNGNEAGKAYWAQSAEAALHEIRNVEQKLSSLDLEEGVRKRILDIIQQAQNAEATHQASINNTDQGLSRLDQTLDRVSSRLLQMVTTMLILRGLTSMWREATSYAQKFYDKLNEIRIVTGKSEAEVTRQGQSYRKQAKEMKVSSTEIAVAAVEFWRQGLSESEVNSRLKATIQYAKISAMEFDEAAELITAATNTMQLSAQRVADVFAYLGDASASGPDEIGVAMQKASAAAVEFGLTFEWQGAYIATISEQTRQAPEVIGTALNSIMSRLHSIKQRGYNEEDATKINDVAKALGQIDVALLDNEGNWRAMSDIFSDIAEVWDTLDGKLKSYIATVQAGTRQQNSFLALMNDMAKGVEGGSRAYELYAGAMNAAGTATRKYGVWQESVTAAQNRLTAALQSFYVLLDAEWMKGFYDGMSGLVEVITAGTNALSGWNLLIPAVAAGIVGLIAVVYKAVTAIQAMRAALAAGQGIASIMSGGTIGAIIAAVGALAMVVTMIAGAAASAHEIQKVDYSGTIQTVSDYHDRVDSLVSEQEVLASKTSLTTEEQVQADEIMKALSGTSLSMKAALENGGEGFQTLGEKAAAAREEVDKTNQALRALKAAEALQNLRDAEHEYANAIGEAQSNQQKTAQYGDIAGAYHRYMDNNPTGTFRQMHAMNGAQWYEQENFYSYARNNAYFPQGAWNYSEDKEWAKEDAAFWQGIVAEMEQLGIDYSSSVEEISNKMLEFDIAAGSYADASRASLAGAWQPIFDDLYTVMTNGTAFDQLPQFMQTAATNYYEAYISGIDQQKDLAEGEQMAMAGDLMSFVNGLFDFMGQDSEMMALFEQFDRLYQAPRTEENVAALNAMLPAMNAYITAYNALTDSDADDIPLLTEFLPADQAEQAAQSLLLLSDSLEAYFSSMRKQRDAEAAEESFYADQLAQLRAAWETNDGGESFVNTLNAMNDENDTLTKGLLETHEVLMDMASGTVSYEDGLAALTEMEKLTTRQAQERTAALLDEADAERALEVARKDHYAGVLSQLSDAYNQGYEAFITQWDELSGEAKADLVELYPEVAKLATVMGETADGAQVFSQALEKAANMDFTSFTEDLSTARGSRSKREEAQAASENNYRQQLAMLESALSTGGVDAMRRAMFDLYTENEELYEGLMETYGILYQLGDMSLTSAEAADVLSEAYRTQVAASIKSVEQMREQMAMEDKMAQSAKGYYADTLRELQSAYREHGAIGFHEVWMQLDDDAKRYILRTYSAIGDQATESIDRSVDVVDAIFEEAIAQAMAMNEALLMEELTADAAGYGNRQKAEAAREDGFQEQLVQLRDALADGNFMEVLAGFGEEMTSALLSENEWLYAIIEGLTTAEDGTYSLVDATALLNEHIVGTQEQFMSNVMEINEANAELLANEEAQIAVLESLMDALESGGLEGFRDAFNALGSEMQSAILDASPTLKRFFRDLEDGAADSEDAIDDLSREIKGLNLKKLQKEGKVWENLTDVMEDASKGGKTFVKSYGTVLDTVDDLNEALGALTAIQTGALTSADDLTDAYNILASYTGVSADALRNNLDPAIWAITSDLDMASGSAAYLCNWLWNTAGVTFSAANWQSQLAALAGSADATTANVARLVQTMLQCAGASLSLNGDTIQVKWGAGTYTPPSARSGGGSKSGGGGGGSSNSNVSVSDAIEKLLDKMNATVDIEDHRRKMAQLAQEYHDARGEIQGVILYLQKEREIVQENSATLRGYQATLEAQIAAQKSILAQYAEGSQQYNQAMADLEALQEQHKKYSETLLQNEIDLEKLSQAMQDERDAIRNMEIDLRKLIHDAIMDREALNRRMLEGRIDVENEIIDALTKRYEKERDQLLELAKVKRSAQTEELDMLDKQLEARKKLNDQQDRAKLLAEKEAQLARIAADPTRKKEEMALREEIAKLREEIAWDLAEEEVEAQKKSIQSQIDSIDDYMDYVDSYYEELLSNPRKLIEEMQTLLSQADADILGWLMANHEDYQTATDATREQMRLDWQEMLDDMRGNTQTYWDEVEDIISQGDEAIIQFLKDHLADYKEAGKLQAEAYVDEWQKKLQDLKNAYKQVTGDIGSYDYTPTTSTQSSSSSSSSGSSTKKTSSSSSTKQFVASGTGYAEAYKASMTSLVYDGATYIKDPKSNYWYKASDAQRIDGGRTYYWKTGTTRYVKKYLEGGMASNTGLAWLDGTPQRPERILSPYQTELFENLIRTLHEIKTLKGPGAAVHPILPDAQQPSYHIDSIVVQVQKLESEADYEEMAERVGEHIMDKVARGMAVGGIRLG